MIWKEGLGFQDLRPGTRKNIPSWWRISIPDAIFGANCVQAFDHIFGLDAVFEEEDGAGDVFEVLLGDVEVPGDGDDQVAAELVELSVEVVGPPEPDDFEGGDAAVGGAWNAVVASAS